MTARPDLAAPTPERHLPYPWARGEGCGGPRPALAHPGEHDPYCPACARADLLRHAAGESLAALLPTVLSAWAHHWGEVGLSTRALYEAVEKIAGAWMNADAQREHLSAFLRGAMREHPAPAVIPSPPDRVTVRPAEWGLILAAHLDPHAPPPPPGQPDRRRFFTVREPGGKVREGVTLLPGLDAVLILGAEEGADAALYFTGLRGRTRPLQREGYRVPAALLPAVREALGGWGSAEGVGA
ncbi:hypothetical protein [Deinococcus murrayi]|uniref:hypothetical protein n=1 Tax=Deinococcus murrayi TaxID=68910 RepID=UPI000485BCC8|nr:hypothetical protein [Deinococcus murrayi]